jgi:hypothetical protein
MIQPPSAQAGCMNYAEAAGYVYYTYCSWFRDMDCDPWGTKCKELWCWYEYQGYCNRPGANDLCTLYGCRWVMNCLDCLCSCGV